MVDWLSGDYWANVLEHAIRIAVILAIAGVVRAISVKVINRAVRTMVAKRTHPRTAAGKLVAKTAVFSEARREQRIGALGSLGRSAVTILLVVLVALMILQEINFPIATLLAGTSIIGIAVAFGVQTFLRDILCGILMMVEDQIGMGDYIRVGDVDGVVEYVGLRLTQIRDADGTVWYLRNGDIAKVANYSQGSGTGRPPVPQTEVSS
jgi:moderate conductance mechanosensitive channel